MIELKQKTAVVSDGFDDSAWNAARKGELPLKENETAICRAHLKLTQKDLGNPDIQIHFGTIDDHGWIYERCIGFFARRGRRAPFLRRGVAATRCLVSAE